MIFQAQIMDLGTQNDEASETRYLDFVTAGPKQ